MLWPTRCRAGRRVQLLISLVPGGALSFVKTMPSPAGGCGYCRKLGCDVVGETSFGAEAIDLVSSYCPALLILDQNLPGELDGRAVTA